MTAVLESPSSSSANAASTRTHEGHATRLWQVMDENGRSSPQCASRAMRVLCMRAGSTCGRRRRVSWVCAPGSVPDRDAKVSSITFEGIQLDILDASAPSTQDASTQSSPICSISRYFGNSTWATSHGCDRSPGAGLEAPAAGVTQITS